MVVVWSICQAQTLGTQRPGLNVSGLPLGGTVVTNSATGTTGSTVATLPAAVNQITYLCGFRILANATGAATGNAAVTNTTGGTLNFTQWTAPLASGIGNINEEFSPCIPATASNTTIVVTSAAPGSGGVISVTAWGYQY
jgi:hypothetical protein